MAALNKEKLNNTENKTGKLTKYSLTMNYTKDIDIKMNHKLKLNIGQNNEDALGGSGGGLGGSELGGGQANGLLDVPGSAEKKSKKEKSKKRKKYEK